MKCKCKQLLALARTCALCTASSLVGLTTSALTPSLPLSAVSFACITSGRRKASVLPDPVSRHTHYLISIMLEANA